MFSTPEYIQAEIAYRTEQAMRSRPVKRRQKAHGWWTRRKTAA